MRDGAPRRLAAIVAADIAGYSVLMGRNEELTHKRVRAIEREVIEPTVTEYRGQVVKTMGDGFLAVFNSPVEAVRCALVIQQNMIVRNLELPKVDWIQYRIGVNLGDIIIDNDDIFGEGVNIAARLQQLAEPGVVFVSGGIYEQIKYKLIAGYQSLGDRKVKHIGEPVPIYRVLPDPTAYVRAQRRQRIRMLAITGVALVALGGAGGWFAWKVHASQKLALVTGRPVPPPAIVERHEPPASAAIPAAAPTAAEPTPAPEQLAVANPPPVTQAETAPRPREPEMVAVLGGVFLMGSNTDPSEGHPHQVHVKPFLLGRYPITVREWRDCVAAHGCDDIGPETGGGDADTPMTNLSWADARRYAAWLAAATGKDYRLVTEAEWEYAARAGSKTTYWWGARMIADVADCKECGRPYDQKLPLAVGALKANPFGLYDMAGGVAQWTADCWHRTYKGAPPDGSAWQTPDCPEHVLRGGSWRNDASEVRAAAREFYDTTVRYPTHGMRVARSASETE
jgi:formylglycine-generating enzyme required for sulfatase activity/class 3 adenylate cyclase